MKKLLSFMLILAILAGLLMMPASANEKLPFTDVNESSWYYDNVDFVYREGIMVGTSDTKFEPQSSLTRAMFAAVLCRMAGESERATTKFTDIPQNAWYAGYVGWAAESGVFTGYNDGTFKPQSFMTREEAAAAIVRYIDVYDINLPRENDAPYEFSDGGEIGEWAREYVDKLRISGIFEGDNNANYNPEKSITRAEISAVIKRLYEAKEKAWQGYIPDPDSDGYAVYGANYLYWSGNSVQGGLGTDIDKTASPYPALEAYPDDRSAELSYEDADTVGFSATATLLDLTKLPVVKICYAYEGMEEPENLTSFISNRTAMESTYASAPLSFTAGEKDEGWSTAVFDTTDAAASLPNVTYGTSGGSNVHIMFKPFGNTQSEDARFLIRYIAFFPDTKTAESFESEQLSEYLNGYYLYTNVSYKEADDQMVEGYLEKIRERIAEIKNSPSLITPESIEAEGGTCYYISSINGDDSNDGLTPETPWKSLENLFYTKMGVSLSTAKPGDGVFFERGSIFYPNTYFNHTMCTLGTGEGVSYGAYGEGPKPVFTMSLDFGGGAGTWYETEWDDVYVLDQIDARDDNFAREDGDIGGIIFNSGEMMGVRVFPNDSSDPFGDGKTTKYMGERGNCVDYYISGGTSCKNPGDALRNNLEFIHDYKEGKLYLRCEYGNPGEYFDTINVCRNGNIVFASKDSKFDNLAFLYSSYIGLDLSDGNVVTNCEAGYCGGSDSSVGTGIGGYGACDSLTIDNCYIHDIEDGPMGTQYTNSSEVWLDNVVCTNNVIIAAQNLVELFNTYRVAGEDGLGVNKIRHSRVTGNYAAYLGYGYPQSVDEDAEGLALHNWYYGEMVDCIFENNTMVCCSGSIIGAHVATDNNSRGWSMRNNTYVLNPELASMLRGTDGITYTNLTKSFYAAQQIPYTYRYLAYLTSLGIDPSGDYYYFNNTTESEKFGTFAITGYIVEHGGNAS